MRYPTAALLASILASCSATKPDAVYPPHVGTLPVKPMPEEDELGGDDDDDDDGDETSSAAKPAGPSPIDAALPASPPTELARKASCADKLCSLKEWIPDAAFAKTSDGKTESPAAMWAHSIKAGSTVAFPRHSHLTTLGVVLAGDVLVKGEEAGGAQKLGVWGAFRAPGAGCTVKAEGADAKVVFAVTSTKPTLAESLETGKKTAFAVRWRKRPGTGVLVTKKLPDIEPWSWAGGAAHARIAFGEATAKTGSLGVLTMAPGLGVPEHDHPTSWEHLAVLDGSGKMSLGDQKLDVKPGDAISIPKAVKHAVTRSDGGKVLAVQVYTPAGPEQRYKAFWKDPKMGGTNAPKEPAPAPAAKPDAAKEAPKPAPAPPAAKK